MYLLFFPFTDNVGDSKQNNENIKPRLIFHTILFCKINFYVPINDVLNIFNIDIT